jgi:hypothetical protein
MACLRIARERLLLADSKPMTTDRYRLRLRSFVKAQCTAHVAQMASGGFFPPWVRLFNHDQVRPHQLKGCWVAALAYSPKAAAQTVGQHERCQEYIHFRDCTSATLYACGHFQIDVKNDINRLPCWQNHFRKIQTRPFSPG